MAAHGGRAAEISSAHTQWSRESKYATLAPIVAFANAELAFTLTLHKESDGSDMDFDVIASDAGMFASIHAFTECFD
jgi:hypothetical protein